MSIIRIQLEAHAERNRQEMAHGRTRTPWSGGWLAGADLVGANLAHVCLTGANLTCANLTGADLVGADLVHSNLVGAKLTDAILTHADLEVANLADANLYRVNLTGANLYRANLTQAKLIGADLTHANLYRADLTGANLTHASLYRAKHADTTGATWLRRPDMPDPSELRARVADHIAAHPKLHAQGEWGDGSGEPACQTPCCVAGWACHLGGGSYGLEVPTAATILLHVDGQPMPSFVAAATRDEILRALRGES